MDLPRMDRMSNTELLIILVGLLVVFGLVGAMVLPGANTAELGGCCDAKLVVQKVGGLNGFVVESAQWKIDKYATQTDIYNASDTPIEYFINVTEISVDQKSIMFYGTVSVKNNGDDSAYLTSIVNRLYVKNTSDCYTPAANVLTYNDSTTSVEICDLETKDAVATMSEGIGSVELVVEDQYGNDPFATNGTYPSGMYEIPGKSTTYFHYYSNFDLEALELNESNVQRIRDQIVLTFIDVSGKSAGFCSDINSTGTGIIPGEYFTDAFQPASGPCSNAKELKEYPVNTTTTIDLYDIINQSPTSIMTVHDFTVNGTDTLPSDGSGTWSTVLKTTGELNHITTIRLNSTATCNSDGVTLIRNKAWVEADDPSKIFDNPDYAQINFICGDVEPPPEIGHMCTYTQSSYGGYNETAYTEGFEVMNGSFTTIYPSGLVVGNSGDPYSLTLTSSLKVAQFLPQDGAPSYLLMSLTDPTSTSAGEFAGEVVALQLNVDLSEEGVMPQTSDEKYGNQIVQGTMTPLDGKSVRDVLDIANCLLANGTDCDGYETSDIPKVNEVAIKLNLNYYNCENDFNWTREEDTIPPVIWSVEAVPDLMNGTQQYYVVVNVTDDIAVGDVKINVDGSVYDLDQNGTFSELWQEYGIPAPPDDGTYTIYVTAKDTSDNTATDDSESIIVDAFPPVIELELPLYEGAVITPGTLINFSVTDAGDHLETVLVNISYDTSAGTELVDFPSPFDVDTTGWAEGDYTIYIFANDTVSNANESTYHFIVDSTDPKVELEADPEVTNTDNNVTFTAEVEDENLDTGAVYLFCENDEPFDEPVNMICQEVSTGVYTCEYNWTPTNDGEYTCTVTATDEAGNEGTSNEVTVIIDSEPPDIQLNSPEEGSYIKAGTLINLSITNGEYDELASAWYTHNGTTTEYPLDDPYDIPTSGLECQYTFTVWAYDTAGNLANETFHFNIDNTAPTINLVTETPNSMYPSDPYEIVVNATDNKMMGEVNATVDGVTYVLTQNETFTDLWHANAYAPAPGTYPVYVDAYDGVGHHASDSSTSITVNTPPGPVIVLKSPANQSTIKNTVPVVVNITSGGVNPLSDAWFHSSNNPTNRPFDSVSGDLYNIDLNSYADGTYTFYVFANDTYPRTSSAVYQFTIDSTAPVVTSLTVSPDVFNKNTWVTFTASVNESNELKDNEVTFSCTNGVTTYSFSSDACTGTAPSFTCSITKWITWPDGYYDCTAYAEDSAGNSDTSEEVPITIDSTKPTITLHSPLPPMTIIKSGTLINFSVTNGVYDDLDTVLYCVDCYNPDLPFSEPYDIDTTGLSDGMHCFKVWANDTAGNVRTKTVCYIFDNTPPVIHNVVPTPDHVGPGGLFDISSEVTDHPLNLWFRITGDVTLTIGNDTYTLNHDWWPPSQWDHWKRSSLNAPSGDISEVCGYHALSVTATDSAGNSATNDTEKLAVVGCVPVIKLIGPAEGTINQGDMIDFEITHPFNFTANVSYDGVGPKPFTDPFNILGTETNTWVPGQTYTVTINATDEFGYSSSGTYTFTVYKPGPGPEDKTMKVERGCYWDGSTSNMRFVTKTKTGDNINDVKVRLVYWVGGIATQTWEDYTSGGVVDFPLGTAGEYSASLSKGGYKTVQMEKFDFELCPPDIPPPPCEDDEDCPGDEICEDGECIPPECNDTVTCPSGEICVEGRCEPEPPECTEDSDCAEGYVCEGGECVPEEPECETDGDCAAGYVCVGGECLFPDMDVTPPDPPIVPPGQEITLEFQILSNGTAPVTNVDIVLEDIPGVLDVISTSGPLTRLNPGESASVFVTVRIGDDADSGEYTVDAAYKSNEVSKSDYFYMTVAEEVIPGLVLADPLLCLLPLLLLLLALLAWFLLSKKIVADGDSFKMLYKAGKLGFANKYYVSDSVFAKLTAEQKKKAVTVTVGKARLAKVMKKFGLSKGDAELVAMAEKVKANRVLSVSKAFAKLAKSKEKLEGLEFMSPESILKPKK